MNNSKRLVDQILKININSSINKNEFQDCEINNQKTRDWCPYCNQDTTFIHNNISLCINESHITNNRLINRTYNRAELLIKNKQVFIHQVVCSMEDSHIILYAYEETENKIFKFAEYPFDLIKRKVPMPKGKLIKDAGADKELLQAYVSAQNNLWIGAYTYIRRTLEKIIDFIKNKNSIKFEKWNKQTLGKKMK